MAKTILFLLISVILFANANSTEIKSDSFSESEIEMIMNGSPRKPMRVLLTTSYPDSMDLRKQSVDVIADHRDPVLTLFMKRLYATVTDSNSLGVGIAAPQVGILKNIIWVQRFDKDGEPFEVFLNPKITKFTELKQDCYEGCLSIPDERDTTRTRAYAILLEYDNLDGSRVTEMVEGFTAVIFQHEIDHLNGILFTDYIKENAKTEETE